MTRILALTGLLVLMGAPAPVLAGNIYKFTDANGNVLFTNVVNGRKKPQGESFKQYTKLEKVTWFKDTNVHKYSNWGDSEYAVRPSFSKNRNAFDTLIRESALAQNVDHGLVKAIIHTESGFNPKARSKPGAQGLMQVLTRVHTDKYEDFGGTLAEVRVPDREGQLGNAGNARSDPEQSPGLFVATGFNGWGISNGTAVGLGMARQIITGRCPWKQLYDPNRPSPDDFNQSSDSQTRVDDLDAIGPGEGGVITRGDEQLAVWRDDAGTLHAVSAACTHMGCSVTWNNADRTWDCPCHGSIFQADGEVIHGPAIEPLAARSL